MQQTSELSNQIREFRLELRMTQEQFANELKVSFTSINRWENGHSKPSPLAREKLELLAQQQGVTLDL